MIDPVAHRMSLERRKLAAMPEFSATKPPKVERVLPLIRRLRGELVLLDSDLHSLLNVRPIAVERAVANNPRRFPHDFMFRLTATEREALLCQVDLKRAAYWRRSHLAFTMGGVAMLVGALRLSRATRERLLPILRAFAHLRNIDQASSVEGSRHIH